MMKRNKSLFATVVITFIVARGFCSDQPPMDTNELVHRFIQRWHEEEEQNLDRKYGFIERNLHDELDKNGKSKQHRDRTFQLIALEGHPFLRLIEKDAKPLSAEDSKKQAEQESRFLEEQRKEEQRKEEQRKKDGQHQKGEEKKENSDEDDVKLDERFVSHFKFDIVGHETLNGRDNYMVSVLPKASDVPPRNNNEKILFHMQGTVWLDAQDFSMAKCDIHLAEPASFYGVLGTVRQLDLLLQRRLVDGQVWMPQKIVFSLDARKLFTSIRMKQESQYSDFKKIIE